MRSQRHAILAILLCIGAASLIGFLEWQRRLAPPTTTGVAPMRPAASGIANAVRMLKLVTWQFDTTISADSVSDKWYGNAVASVRAPVRYQYGVDLSRLERSDVLFGEEGEIVFLVPPPERISVDVDLEKLEQTLDVSGARWKSHNQDQIDSARTKLAEIARSMTLSPDDAKRLREASRAQLETLFAKTLNDQGYPRISVQFVE